MKELSWTGASWEAAQQEAERAKSAQRCKRPARASGLPAVGSDPVAELRKITARRLAAKIAHQQHAELEAAARSLPGLLERLSPSRRAALLAELNAILERAGMRPKR